jgi:dTDP-glucose pyrophosphorylase
MGWIGATDLERLGQAMAKNAYGQYLLALLREPSQR